MSAGGRGWPRRVRIGALQFAGAADGLVAFAASLVLMADAAFGNYAIVHRWGYGRAFAGTLCLMVVLLVYRFTMGRRYARRTRLMRWFAAMRPA